MYGLQVLALHFCPGSNSRDTAALRFWPLYTSLAAGTRPHADRVRAQARLKGLLFASAVASVAGSTHRVREKSQDRRLDLLCLLMLSAGKQRQARGCLHHIQSSQQRLTMAPTLV